nr:ribonuclease H-like domain-containing protein [Tanacetum cinerariifolium]
MESLSPQVVAAAKLPIVNLNEFDLWKMRIEQYFLITDYSLWEVLLNGDSPTPTRVVDDAKSLMEAIEKRFGGNKEIKNAEDYPQTIRNKADLEDQSLDDLCNNLRIYKAEVKSSSSTSHTIQNIAFVSSQKTNNTNESVSVVTSVSTASTKPSASILSNVDNLSDAVIYSFFARGFFRGLEGIQEPMEPLISGLICPRWNATTAIEEVILQGSAGHIGTPGIKTLKEEMFHWRLLLPMLWCHSMIVLVAMIEAFRLMKNQHTMPSWHLPPQAHQVLKIRKSQFDVISYKSSLESVETRLVVYQQNENVFEEDIKLLKLDVMLRDNTLVELRKKFEKAKQERDELKLTLEKFQTFSKNLSKLLASQIIDKTRLEYDNQVFKSKVFDYDELISSKSDESVPTSPVHDSEIVHTVFNVEPTPTKPTKDMSQLNRPYAPIIEDWVSNSEDKSEVLTRSRLVPLNVARPVTTAVPQTNVKHQRPATHVVNKPYSPIRRPINHRPSPTNHNFHQKVTTVKTKKVNVIQGTKGNWIHVSHGLGPQKILSFLFDMHGNPQQALKDKCVIDSGCSRHMTGNISYLSDFKEINRGYVSFGGNPKGGKITCKGKEKTGKLVFDDVYFIKELKFNLFSVSQMCDKKNSVLFTDTKCVVLSFDFKLPDENHVLLRVPRENNMYNVDLKNIVPLGDLTCLFMNATLDESNLWHRRLGHINFKTMNKLVKGIKREFSVVRTPQQNRVAERKNRTLIEAARTMLAARYVQNRVLVTKPHNKTPYELLLGNRPTWLFDIDTLTQSMNYQPVVTGNQPNHNVENEYAVHVSPSSSYKPKKHDENAKREAKGKSFVDLSTGVRDLSDEFEEFSINSTNRVNASSAPVTAIRPNSTNNTNSFNAAGPFDTAVSPTFEIGGKSSFVDPSQYPNDPDMPDLEDIIYLDDEEDVGAEVDFSNLETSITVSPIPTTSIHKYHLVTQIIGDLSSAPQTKSTTRMVKETEPKIVHQALKDPSWIKVMQEELLQFKMQKVINRTMSSPNHPTSNIEDAFSSNFLDFIPASLDYVPTSPGKTYSNSSNSFGAVPIASPSLLLFHNDPYMKVLQSFYAKESPIPPPNPITPLVILTPSLVLPPSLLFDPLYFFVPEELLPPKKQIHPPSSSSTTLSNLSSFSTYTHTPPQIYELGKSSIKMSVKHHEEQIE